MKYRKGSPVKLTAAFLASNKGFPWLADLVGTFEGYIAPDESDLSYVKWKGHERTQTVAARHLERVRPS